MRQTQTRWLLLYKINQIRTQFTNRIKVLFAKVWRTNFKKNTLAFQAIYDVNINFYYLWNAKNGIRKARSFILMAAREILNGVLKNVAVKRRPTFEWSWCYLAENNRSVTKYSNGTYLVCLWLHRSINHFAVRVGRSGCEPIQDIHNKDCR